MLETRPAKNHSYSIPIIFLLLIIFAVGLNLIIYQKVAALNRQEEELLDYQNLSDNLDRLTDQYNELQNRYDLLLQEKEELERILNSQNISRGTYNPRAYLTIDDGPGICTNRLLQVLDEYGVPATFFVTGQNGSGDENIYSNIVKHGHALGNHTFSHDYKKIYKSKESFMEDLLRLEDLLDQTAGVRPDIVRFPGGTSTTWVSPPLLKEIIAELKERGYDYFDWNISTGDCNSSLTANQLVANVDEKANGLSGQDLVILLHSFNSATVDALPQIIEKLKMNGYTFAVLKSGIVNVKHR